MQHTIPIIIVDDDADDRTILAEALRDAGVTNPIESMNDGQVVIERLLDEIDEKKPFYLVNGIILLDLNMPLKSGREVLKLIRQHAKLCHIPVIVYTTSDAHEEVRQTYRAGANSYITKTSSYNDLLKIVKALDNYWFHVVRVPNV